MAPRGVEGRAEELRCAGEARWDQQWNRWRERALTVDVERELARVERAGGGFMTPADPRWPVQLSCLGEEEPLGLWFLGRLSDSSQSEGHVSIVGARASTSAGGRCARNMAYHLARSGYAIVSGGAIGIDIEAHRGRWLAAGERSVFWPAGYSILILRVTPRISARSSTGAG